MICFFFQMYYHHSPWLMLENFQNYQENIDHSVCTALFQINLLFPNIGFTSHYWAKACWPGTFACVFICIREIFSLVVKEWVLYLVKHEVWRLLFSVKRYAVWHSLPFWEELKIYTSFECLETCSVPFSWNTKEGRYRLPAF